MAIIVQRLTDNRLQLGREEILRPLTFGTNWNTIRIAALIQVYGAASWNQPLSLPQIALGVTTGPKGILVDDTVDAIGAAPSSAWANTIWQFMSAGTLLCSQVGGAWLQKIGTTWTTTTQGSGAMSIPCQDNAGSAVIRRCPVLLDIAKSTYTTGLPSSYGYQLWGPTSLVDVPTPTFFDRIQTYGAPTGMSSFSTATVTVAGSYLHDTAFLMWGNCTPPLDLAAFAVVRLG